MSKMKCHIKKGDTVEVIAGDDKGKTGKVLFLNTKSGRALVEGCKMVKKHMRPTEEAPQGGIVEMESGIAVSNLKLVK